MKPDTVVRWHQAGFRMFWRWKSKRGKKTGRPPTKAETCEPITAEETRDLVNRAMAEFRVLCHQMHFFDILDSIQMNHRQVVLKGRACF